jgi:hypothetical protein
VYIDSVGLRWMVGMGDEKDEEDEIANEEDNL